MLAALLPGRPWSRPRRGPVDLFIAVVLAALAATCTTRASPLPATYGSSIFHVAPPVASSHQSVTLSDEPVVHSVDHHPLEREDHDPPTPYNFEYKVHDQKNSNYHERAESSDGKVVRGFYSLLEPHGEVRVVKYRADHGGFKSEVSRHGSSHGHGGGLGATIGGGMSHDLGSHGLGTSSSVPAPVSVHIPAHVPTYPKKTIPIHEESDEGNQWSAIEDPKKGGVPLRSQALEEIPAPSKEALSKPRVPEQILLQQHKKKPIFQPSKPHPSHKYLKRPPPSFHHGPRPGISSGSGPRPLGAPHFHHRGPKRGPSGPRPRSAHVGGPPLLLPLGPGNAPAAPSPQRREARPPPTPCKCSEQPLGHAAGHAAGHAVGHPPSGAPGLHPAGRRQLHLT